MIAGRWARWARFWRAVSASHRGVWESLHEPRQETVAMVGFYGFMAVSGVSVFLTEQGVLPTGTYSTRLSAAAALVLGGVIGAPTAWRGVWRMERVATVWIGVAAVLRIIAVVTFHDTVAEPTAIFAGAAWVGVIVAMRLRWLRIRVSDYRADAGPIPAHLEAELAMERLRRAEGDRKCRGAQCG